MKAIAERYANSVGSSNLMDDEMHHQTDILASVSLSSKLGSLLYRVKFSGDKFSLAPLLDVWRQIVLKKAANRSWSDLADQVADISLWFWVDDMCQHCKGRGHIPVAGPETDGRQVLSDVPCPICKGSKKRKIVCDKAILRYVEDCVQTLERMANEAGRLAEKKLGA